MSDTWIIPGGPTLQENEDGAVWLVPGVAVVQEAEAAGGAEHTKNLNDTINMTDSRIVNFGLNKADTVSLSDIIAKRFSFSKTDIISFHSSFVLFYQYSTFIFLII